MGGGWWLVAGGWWLVAGEFLLTEPRVAIRYPTGYRTNQVIG
jgi:hypothetical protein